MLNSGFIEQRNQARGQVIIFVTHTYQKAPTKSKAGQVKKNRQTRRAATKATLNQQLEGEVRVD